MGALPGGVNSLRVRQASEWSSCRDRGQAVGCRALMGDGLAGARKECGALGRGCPPEAWPYQRRPLPISVLAQPIKEVLSRRLTPVFKEII